MWQPDLMNAGGLRLFKHKKDQLPPLQKLQWESKPIKPPFHAPCQVRHESTIQRPHPQRPYPIELSDLVYGVCEGNR